MGTNGVIIYYSWIGNTKAVAEELQTSTGFDILQIQEKKSRKPGNIMGAATSAFLGFRSSLMPMDYSLQSYDSILLGTPVWGGKTTPALNSFLGKANLKGKNIWIFITKADEKVPQKVIDSIAGRIGKKGGKFMGSLCLTTKWDPKTNIPMSGEDFRSSIEEWLDDTDLMPV